MQVTKRGARPSLLRAVASGLLLGVLARVVMRGIAFEAGVPGGLSIGGSLEVIAFGAIVGTPVALLFGLIRARVPIARPWFGAFVGLIVFGALAAWPPPSAASALAETPDAPLATAASFGVMFLIWGMVLDLITKPERP